MWPFNTGDCMGRFDCIYLPFSVGWFIILVFTTSAGVPNIAATNPEQALY
jgi:hypothetical protein